MLFVWKIEHLQFLFELKYFFVCNVSHDGDPMDLSMLFFCLKKLNEWMRDVSTTHLTLDNSYKWSHWSVQQSTCTQKTK